MLGLTWSLKACWGVFGFPKGCIFMSIKTRPLRYSTYHHLWGPIPGGSYLWMQRPAWGCHQEQRSGLALHRYGPSDSATVFLPQVIKWNRGLKQQQGVFKLLLLYSFLLLGQCPMNSTLNNLQHTGLKNPCLHITRQSFTVSSTWDFSLGNIFCGYGCRCFVVVAYTGARIG